MVLAVALCVPVVVSARSSTTAAAAVRPHAAGSVLFDDEFDGPAGSSPSSSWLQMTGSGPLGGGEEVNTQLRSNSYLDGAGHLVIAAQRLGAGAQSRFTSAWLETADAFGPVMHVEARMKIAGGLGTWPLFWLLGGDPFGLEWPNKGEIDVGEEIGREPTNLVATLHGYTSNPDHYKHTSGGGTQQEWEDSTHIDTHRVLADGFHTYATDITPDQVTWYFDGVAVKTYRRSQLQSGDVWSFTYPMHVILNLSLGGFFAGPVPDTEPFPVRTIVDYVRITDQPQSPAAVTGTPPPAASTSCDPRSHGQVRVTVSPAKGASTKGGTIALKRSNKVVQHKPFTYRRAVGFCVKPGTFDVIASTKNASKSKSVKAKAENTTAVSFTLR